MQGMFPASFNCAILPKANLNRVLTKQLQHVSRETAAFIEKSTLCPYSLLQKKAHYSSSDHGLARTFWAPLKFKGWGFRKTLKGIHDRKQLRLNKSLHRNKTNEDIVKKVLMVSETGICLGNGFGETWVLSVMQKKKKKKKCISPDDFF